MIENSCAVDNTLGFVFEGFISDNVDPKEMDDRPSNF